MSPIIIGTSLLKVMISPVGAELTSLRDAEGREWLWQGDSRSWARQAPILFPVVGRCRGGIVRHGGKAHPMPIHGLAPTAIFDVVSATDRACMLRLTDDTHTRKTYPFGFRLEIGFEVSGYTLIQRAEITNTGNASLPYSFGFHPGFQWPLPTSRTIARKTHQVLFQADEPGPVRRPLEEGLGPAIQASPVAGKVLSLSDDLFAAGAIVFDALESRRLWFGAPNHEGLLVSIENLPHLGLWARPPAAFLCIEPWQGYADPVGFDGDLTDKPGTRQLTVGETSFHTMRLSFSEPAPSWGHQP
jgi:galactose mutarotase-like enzyme